MLAGLPPGALDAPDVRTVLYGLNSKAVSTYFCTNVQNIRWTEYLEYVLQGKSSQPLPYFQAYKFIFATLLADNGYIEESAKYD
jgi:hypothetical protein